MFKAETHTFDDCCGCFNETIGYSGAYLNENTVIQEDVRTKLVMKIRMQHLKLIWGLRERAQQIHPEIHAVDLIIAIPSFPTGVWDILHERLALNELNKNPHKYDRYPSIARMIKINPKRFLEERLRSEYRDYYKNSYPELTIEDAENLSALNWVYKLIMRTTVDDLIVAMFGSQEQFAQELNDKYEKYRKDKNAQPDDLNVCGLIPDSFDFRNHEQAESNETTDE